MSVGSKNQTKAFNERITHSVLFLSSRARSTSIALLASFGDTYFLASFSPWSSLCAWLRGTFWRSFFLQRKHYLVVYKSTLE